MTLQDLIASWRRLVATLSCALESALKEQHELGMSDGEIATGPAEAQLDSERKQQTSLQGAHRRLLNAPSLTVALAPTPIAAAAAILADRASSMPPRGVAYFTCSDSRSASE